MRVSFVMYLLNLNWYDSEYVLYYLHCPLFLWHFFANRYNYQNLSRILCPAQDRHSYPDVSVDVSTMSSALQNFSIFADLEPIYFEYWRLPSSFVAFHKQFRWMCSVVNVYI